MRKIIFLLVPALLLYFTALAQNRTISGKVLDQNKKPVSGASIMIKGTNQGTAAAEDGSFSLQAKTGETLTVSAINYGAQDVKVGASNELTIVLQAAENSIEGVVVTALGIRREARSLTYATQVVGSDELNKSGTSNPLSELNGKASGLTVINSTGDPGGGTYIRLRGVTSITGSNQPLMVIDGVPVDNSVNNYDPTNAGFLACRRKCGSYRRCTANQQRGGY